MAAICLQNFHYHISNLPRKSPCRPSRLFSLPMIPSIVPKITHSSLSMNNPHRDNNPMMRRSFESCGDFNCRDYFDEEYCEQLEYRMNMSHQHFHHHDEECYDDENQDLATENINSDETSVGYYSSMSCWISSKLELFGPSFFGMKPDPSPEYWPEDDATKRSVEFAMEVQRRRRGTFATMSSINMAKVTKQKYYWPVAGDFSYCSVRKVFSLTVFMIRELLSYVLSIRECLYSEDLRKVIDRVQMEMNYTFVWLFESVFATTPTLMVSVMLLLANFTAHSMAGTAEMAAGLPRVRSSASGLVSYCEEEEEVGGGEEMMMVSLEEKELWGKMLKKMMASEEESLSVNINDDDSMETAMVSRVTDCLRSNHLFGQKDFTESTRYSLLLLNSALFFNPNPQLHDRVEECFKRAIVVEPWDAEVRTLYADFLWLIKKDLESAEEKYLEAVEAEPSYYHASKYATFLFGTGNLDICFPLYDYRPNF